MQTVVDVMQLFTHIYAASFIFYCIHIRIHIRILLLLVLVLLLKSIFKCHAVKKNL